MSKGYKKKNKKEEIIEKENLTKKEEYDLNKQKKEKEKKKSKKIKKKEHKNKKKIQTNLGARIFAFIMLIFMILSMVASISMYFS